MDRQGLLRVAGFLRHIQSTFLLAIILLTGGCISTDGPFLFGAKSEAPQALIGLWGSNLLVEPVDKHSLRVTATSDGKIDLRTPVHSASLSRGFYLIEHLYGLQLVRIAANNTLSEVAIHKNVTQAQIDALTQKYEMKVGATSKGGIKVVDRISGTDKGRLIQLLNELIAKNFFVASTVLGVRNKDAAAINRLRALASAYDKQREARFAMALRKMSGDANTRGSTCGAMTELAIGGHVEALAQDGRCRLHGWGSGKDQDMGFRLLDYAASFGSPTANYEIGKAFVEGSHGRPRVESFGRTRLSMAAEQGSRDARTMLAQIDNPAMETRAKPGNAGARTDRMAGWKYAPEKQGNSVVARIASLESTGKTAKLLIRSKGPGAVAIYFFDPDFEDTGTLDVIFSTANGAEERSYIYKTVGDDWYEVHEPLDLYQRLTKTRQFSMGSNETFIGPDFVEFLAAEPLDPSKL